ncbi:CAP domain-containing protein, partial [Halorubrum yunnanense]
VPLSSSTPQRQLNSINNLLQKSVCTEHRLPEAHDCQELKLEQAQRALKREADEDAGPWFKDGFELSNVEESHTEDRTTTHPADEPAEPTDECETCETELLEHEAAGCPYCEKVFCGEHLADHRADCFNPPAQDNVSGDSNRALDVGSSPDVAPDGSVVRDTSAQTQGPEAENSDSIRVKGFFRLLIGVPTGIASRVAGTTKASFRHPATAIWNITKVTLLLGIVVVLAGQAGFGPVNSSPGELASPVVDAATNATDPAEIDEQQVEKLVREGINERRADHGLASLSSSTSLQEQARLHSEDMVGHDELAHDLPGSTTEQRLTVASCDAGGENIAQTWYQEQVDTVEGQKYIGDEEELAESLVTQWMNSPPHRENILREGWSETGVGIELTDDDKVYATQLFCA